MRLLSFSVFVAVLFAASCAPEPQTPSAAKRDYPSTIKSSPDRRAKAEREWRRMLDAYKVLQTAPDLYPITDTPRSLLGIPGGLPLLSTPPEPGSEKIVFREAVKGFIDRWRELLGADPTVVSLVTADESSALNRFTYRQSNYSLPIAGNYGEMVAVVSREGRLMQLDDRFIPLVELPARPRIEREAVGERVVGRTFKYSDIAGREQSVRVNSADEIAVKQLVVLPLEKGDTLEVHLAWQIVAGSSLSWTVYLDAMSGDELQVVQNFNT